MDWLRLCSRRIPFLGQDYPSIARPAIRAMSPSATFTEQRCEAHHNDASTWIDPRDSKGRSPSLAYNRNRLALNGVVNSDRRQMANELGYATRRRYKSQRLQGQSGRVFDFIHAVVSRLRYGSPLGQHACMHHTTSDGNACRSGRPAAPCASTCSASSASIPNRASMQGSASANESQHHARAALK